MPKRVPPKPFVDPATGDLTLAAIQFLNDLENNPEDGISAIGTRLSGVAQKTDGIIAGTQPLVDVLISGVGKIKTIDAAQNANINAVTQAVGGSALSATASSSNLAGSAPTPGTVTTNTVTVTPAGGTAPYTYAWAKVSGDDFTITAPTAAATSFSVTLGVDGSAAATYACTVTDDAAATFVVSVSVFALILAI